MVKKVIWMFTSILIIITLGFSACKDTTTTNTTTVATGTTQTQTGTTTTAVTTGVATTTSATTTANANQPSYGGTITFIFGHSKATDYFDPIISAIGGHLACVTYDKGASTDWGKGPNGGTGENPFLASYFPDKWKAMMLVESLEVQSIHEITLHVRKGVNFHSKPPANGRELTSADIVYSYERGLQDPRNGAYWYANWEDAQGLQGWRDYYKAAGRTDEEMDAWFAQTKADKIPIFSSSYMLALDKYTIKWCTFWNNPSPLDGLTGLFVMGADTANVDLTDWHNACGTGAWIVQDCVNASSVTWARNPNYWMYDPKYPQNKLPYADFLRGLIILDESTGLAAMRTHKVDRTGVSFDKVEGLKKSNPELLSRLVMPGGSMVIFMRTDKPPFDDVRVRQALSMGVDRDTILNGYFRGNAILDAWPCLPSNEQGYTPIKDMPPDVKQLYEYHPDLAKQLLTEAGYPNGFDITVNIYSSPIDNDQLQIVIDQWAAINVRAKMVIVEGATHSSILYQRTYQDMIYTWWGNSSPESVWGWAHGGVVTSIYSFSGGPGVGVQDPIANETWEKIYSNLTDPEEKSKVLKAEYLREDALVWEIPLCTPAPSIFWQPYLKGYAGETNMGPGPETGSNEIYKFLWIDTTLRAKWR